MDAREQLRRYLEQRREAGERELILDQLTVDEAMRLIGDRSPAPPSSAGAEEPSAGDWRNALRESPGGDVTPATRLRPPSDAPRAFGERDRPIRTKDRGDVGSAIGESAIDEPAIGDGSRSVPEVAGEGVAMPRAEVGREPGGFARDATPSGEASETHATMPLERVPSGLVVGTAGQELFGGTGQGLATLDELVAAVAGCTLCPLHKTAKNPVPGEGDPNAGMICVGEAPGGVEDELGRPFVGPAGQLLDSILKAIRLSRKDVYICNVLKHRPPQNRNPMPTEVDACSPYLVRQIELIKPKVVVAFGTFAAQTLLKTKDPIGRLRGKIHRYYGVPLVVTYHPAALLRNPGWKRPTWDDVQLARRLLDRAVST